MTEEENKNTKESSEVPAMETNSPEIQEEIFVPKLSEAEKLNIEAEDKQHLETEKSILKAVDNSEFVKKILPEAPEKIDVKVLDRALETLLDADGVELSREERMKLFQIALEYYSSPTETKVPLFHSTGSMSLRNGLESGFRGGFGEFTGEGSYLEKKDKWTAQKDLSVSRQKYPYVEEFQQLYARASARKDELGGYLAVDSEKITGRDLPEHLIGEIRFFHTSEELVEIVARQRHTDPKNITKEEVDNFLKAGVEMFRKMESTLEKREREKEILPTISDERLRNELAYEIEHPFPCFITFEGLGKEDKLQSVRESLFLSANSASYPLSWKNPTHVPPEDRFMSTLDGEDIREIRVPQNQIEKVQGWLEAKGLNGVKIVPIEVYEIKRIIQNCAR